MARAPSGKINGRPRGGVVGSNKPMKRGTGGGGNVGRRGTAAKGTGNNR